MLHCAAKVVEKMIVDQEWEPAIRFNFEIKLEILNFVLERSGSSRIQDVDQ